jgi:hypothetical protein
VDVLVRRLQGVLPHTPLVGGVLVDRAWGRRPLGGQHNSLRGALFLGSKALDEGAVGCLLKGPFHFDSFSSQASTF